MNPPSPKHGFGDHRRHRLRRNDALEGTFQIVRKGFGGRAFFTAIGVSKRNAVNVACERSKASFIRMRLAGQGHGQQSAAMKGIFEANNRRALGVCAGDFDGIFNGFGAAVDQKGLLCKVARRQRVQLFCKGNVAFIGRHTEAKVQKFLELFPNRCNYARRAMSRVQRTDATGEIDKAVSVHVFQNGALGPSRKNRRSVISSASDRGFAPRHQSTGLRTRNFRTDLNRFHLRIPLPRSSSRLHTAKSQYQPMGVSSKLTNTCLVSRYSSRPHGPSSLPNPDCL